MDAVIALLTVTNLATLGGFCYTVWRARVKDRQDDRDVTLATLRQMITDLGERNIRLEEDLAATRKAAHDRMNVAHQQLNEALERLRQCDQARAAAEERTRALEQRSKFLLDQLRSRRPPGRSKDT